MATSGSKCGCECGCDLMPKAQGRHADKKLSAVRVNSIQESGRYTDGNGLYLEVSETGSKRWICRLVVQGRRRDIGLGSARLVTLAEAREEAFKLRKTARAGGDPIEARNISKRVALTFREAAERVHAEASDSWRNEKHAAQWISTLETYAFPLIGGSPVSQIQSANVLQVLSPIWLVKPETARRVRQRLGTVLDWAKAAGHRDGENPVVGIEKALPKQSKAVKHHEALAYKDVHAFVKSVRESHNGPAVKLALEFLILTASRTGEVLQARWSEIDEIDGVWTVPASRMKAKRQHRVPISTQCKALLVSARSLGKGTFIFPSGGGEKPLSNMALLMAVRRLISGLTVHGFRSAFRDWASEETSFSHEVCEMALAHTIKNKAEAAYRRGDLLEKRRELLEAWANFVLGRQVS